jgi:hypothetical protein
MFSSKNSTNTQKIFTDLIERRICILIAVLGSYTNDDADVYIESCLLLRFIMKHADYIDKVLVKNYVITMNAIMKFSIDEPCISSTGITSCC